MNEADAAVGRRWNELVRTLPTSLTVEEGTQVLRDIHPETLRGYLAAGDVPGRKIGTGAKGSWRLNKLELVRMLDVMVDESDLVENDWHRMVLGLPDWLTTAQTARVLRLHPTTVRALARRGEIPVSRIGPRGTFKFPRAAVLDGLGVLGEFDSAD